MSNNIFIMEDNMTFFMKAKKILLIISIAASILLVGTVSAEEIGSSEGPMGPAPNSGDGVPDGSGFGHDSGANEDSPGIGPAPNSGDGIPDGPGWE